MLSCVKNKGGVQLSIGNPSQSYVPYGITQCYLSPYRHPTQMNAPRLNPSSPARQTDTWFTYPAEIKAEFILVDPDGLPVTGEKAKSL